MLIRLLLVTQHNCVLSSWLDNMLFRLLLVTRLTYVVWLYDMIFVAVGLTLNKHQISTSWAWRGSSEKAMVCFLIAFLVIGACVPARIACLVFCMLPCLIYSYLGWFLAIVRLTRTLVGSWRLFDWLVPWFVTGVCLIDSYLGWLLAIVWLTRTLVGSWRLCSLFVFFCLDVQESGWS